MTVFRTLGILASPTLFVIGSRGPLNDWGGIVLSLAVSIVIGQLVDLAWNES